MAEKRSEASRKQRREYIKRKREICIALGVCRECMARDAQQGIKMCLTCKQKTKTRNKEMREWYKSSGICVNCKENEAIKGKTICVNCSTRDTLNYSKQRYNQKIYNIKRRVHRKKCYIWREQGLCYQCGKPTLPGKKQCEKHYLISKAQADKLNADTSKHIWRRL